MKRSLVALSIILAALMSSCGYSAKSSLPANIKTVCVVPFVNKIDFQSGNPNLYVPLLEVKAQNAVVNEFLFNGHLRIKEEQDADLVLKGELIKYDRNVLRYDDNDDVEEYRVTVTFRFTMLNNKGEILWEEPGFSGEATYFLSGPKASSESDAIEDAVKDLAKRIVERTVEDW